MEGSKLLEGCNKEYVMSSSKEVFEKNPLRKLGTELSVNI